MLTRCPSMCPSWPPGSTRALCDCALRDFGTTTRSPSCLAHHSCYSPCCLGLLSQDLAVCVSPRSPRMAFGLT